MAGSLRLALAALAWSALLAMTAGLEFDMIYQTKCIMEDIEENVIVLGEFSGQRKTDGSAVPLNVKVSTRPSLCTDSSAEQRHAHATAHAPAHATPVLFEMH